MEPGQDSLGRVYSDIDLMWEEEARLKERWYDQANEYWSRQTCDMTGVMGGLPQIHPIDIAGSLSFIYKVYAKKQFERNKALDCGCGIGRVTKHLLSLEFSRVHLVDQCENYVNQARSELGEERFSYTVQGLQDFSPAPEEFDVIWIQWVLSHLTDEDLLSFLERISAGLKKNGVIFVKENIKKAGFMVHKDDFSVTRSEKLLKKILLKRFKIIYEELQTGFPEDLFKVKMFACVPNYI